MTNTNEIFSEEFKLLQAKADEDYKMLMASIAGMQEIPAITDLEICKRLEHAHFNIHVNAISLSDTALRLSQLYHYLYLVSENKE